MKSEVDFLKELVGQEVRRRQVSTMSAIILFSISLLLSIVYVYKYKAIEAENAKLYDDNKKLIEIFEAQQKSVKALKAAGVKQSKIDSIVSDGCLMYFDVNGAK